MQLWQLLLCCVFCTQRREHLYCSGYTSELRPVRAQLVAEDGTTHVISYDPVYVTSAGAAYDVCSLFGCITDVSALEKDIDRLLAACISKSYRPPDYSILIPLVDASTAVELHRLHAASADYALHFQRSVAEWCSDHSHGGSCAVTNVLVELIDLSLKLFSENKYDETFALCYAIFSFLIEHAAVRDAGAVTEEQMGWAYIAYAESARMTGNFNASAWGYNMVLSILI